MCVPAVASQVNTSIPNVKCANILLIFCRQKTLLNNLQNAKVALCLADTRRSMQRTQRHRRLRSLLQIRSLTSPTPSFPMS